MAVAPDSEKARARVRAPVRGFELGLGELHLLLMRSSKAPSLKNIVYVWMKIVVEIVVVGCGFACDESRTELKERKAVARKVVEMNEGRARVRCSEVGVQYVGAAGYQRRGAKAQGEL